MSDGKEIKALSREPALSGQEGAGADVSAGIPAEARTGYWSAGESHEAEVGDEPLIGTLVAERYLIGRVLGRGGMGAVYQAEHLQLQKQVALKILHGYMTQNDEVVQRFEREAIAAGRIGHPGIVAATDFGRLNDGSFYLVLELVEGKSLAELVHLHGRLEPQRAFGIAVQVNDALCAAHAEGIVHRDMKPENVMLAESVAGADFVKVVDFGIAKVRLGADHQEGLTRVGLVFGTPEYMSPEQAMGHEADERSDLYGVGMLLYEMLQGQSPFSADDVTAMLTAQIKDRPPELPESVPWPLRQLTIQLLEKDPALRPQSARQLADAFAELGQELGYALPPPQMSPATQTDIIRLPSAGRRAAERPSLVVAVQSLSMRPVAVGKKRVPLWLPLLGLIVGISSGVAFTLAKRDITQLPAVSPQAAPIDGEAQLIVDAVGGDREAISELRRLTTATQKDLEKSGAITPAPVPAETVATAAPNSLPASVATPAAADERVTRQASRYLVLGRGYAEIKHYSASLEMYRWAVQLDPHLAEDPELLVDVRMALSARDAVDDGLEFALHALGAHGADLIYDVYLDHLGQVGMTSVVARAMKLARSEELLAQATPELRVALLMEEAKLCGDYRKLLPEAASFADERSVKKLRALLVENGCGSSGTRDCYPCLRSLDDSLARALARAETHPAPSFLRAPQQTPTLNLPRAQSGRN